MLSELGRDNNIRVAQNHLEEGRERYKDRCPLVKIETYFVHYGKTAARNRNCTLEVFLLLLRG